MNIDGFAKKKKTRKLPNHSDLKSRDFKSHDLDFKSRDLRQLSMYDLNLSRSGPTEARKAPTAWGWLGRTLTATLDACQPSGWPFVMSSKNTEHPKL